MERKLNIKKVIITGVILVIIIAIVLFINYKVQRKKLNKKLETAQHAITLNENVDLYKNKKAKKSLTKLEIGANIYILEDSIEENGKILSKVYAKNKVGFVLKEEISSYKSTDDKKVLMLDVSKFNMKSSFRTIGEFKAFILKNDIKYIYIRIAGRGYGKKGILYEDEYFKKYSEACEFMEVPFGYYYIDEAITSDEIKEETEIIEELLKNNIYKFNKLPLAIDVENHDGQGRADSIFEERCDLVNELIKNLNDKNINTIVYSNAKIADKYLENVKSYLWLAYYPKLTNIPTYWYSETNQDPAKNQKIIKRMVGWQFTETGVETKINEEVDLSIVYNEFFKKYCNSSR